MWADVAIIPCKASMIEARAIAKNTAFVRQAQAIRKSKPQAVAALSMTGKNYRLTKDMTGRRKGFETRTCENARYASPKASMLTPGNNSVTP